MGHPEELLLPAIESALDGLLTQWAQKTRLSAVQSEAIRAQAWHEAANIPSELTYQWWRRLFAHCTEALPLQSAAFWPAFRLATTRANG